MRHHLRRRRNRRNRFTIWTKIRTRLRPSLGNYPTTEVTTSWLGMITKTTICRVMLHFLIHGRRNWIIKVKTNLLHASNVTWETAVPIFEFDLLWLVPILQLPNGRLREQLNAASRRTRMLFSLNSKNNPFLNLFAVFFLPISFYKTSNRRWFLYLYYLHLILLLVNSFYFLEFDHKDFFSEAVVASDVAHLLRKPFGNLHTSYSNVKTISSITMVR